MVCEQMAFVIIIPSRMYFSSRRRKENNEALQDNVNYPEATIKEYLNLRRTTKDKCCLVIFCIAILITIMMAGIGFFYGHYASIGVFLDSSGNAADSSSCKFLNGTLFCTTKCATGQQPYLQKICIDPSSPPTYSTSLKGQIQIYNFKTTYGTMAYANVGIFVGIVLCFLLLICYPKLAYFYIFLGFLILLGFSFYLLKSVEQRVSFWKSNKVETGPIIQDQTEMTALAYILLAAYLVFFPMILFAPKKIQTAVDIISSMRKYYESMYTISAFTIFVSLAAYGLIFAMGFLLMNFYTDGEPSTSTTSFFYLYDKVNLSNPGALALFFFGTIWMFGTLISWHRYLVGSSVLQWYFQDGGKLQPVRKGLRRAWFQLGSAALDSLLTPIEWIVLILYSITKMDSNHSQDQSEGAEDCLCCSNCIFSFRRFISKAYCKVNRSSVSSGSLTNQTYTEGCEIAAVVFSESKHKFFNIGGSLNLYLGLFSILTFVFINYLALYNSIFLSTNPSPISSLSLPVLLAVSLGIVVGQLMGNMFTAAVDCLLFCYLLEKKNGTEFSNNEVKKILEELYNKEEEVEEVTEMYELQPDE